MALHTEYTKEVINSNTVVIFIHGILESPNQFNDFISLIDTKYSIVNILLPGHGGNGRDFASSGMSKWKNHIYEKLTELENAYDNIFLVGHSMGSLISIDSALKYPTKIKGLFLLAVPISMHLSLDGAISGFKVAFDLVKEHDKIGMAAKEGYSIENKNIFTYLTWLPRYIELFKEGFNTKERISKIQVPTIIFQSYKDEFVSNKTISFIKKQDNIKLNVLKESKHFYYQGKERNTILNTFLEFIDSNI